MVEQDTWVTLLGLAGSALVLFGYLSSMRRDLRAEIVGCRSELKTDIAQLRKDLKADVADVKSDIGRLDCRLTTIEQRTYDLSTRLPTSPT